VDSHPAFRSAITEPRTALTTGLGVTRRLGWQIHVTRSELDWPLCIASFEIRYGRGDSIDVVGNQREAHQRVTRGDLYGVEIQVDGY
jgi:hypothetical protein